MTETSGLQATTNEMAEAEKKVAEAEKKVAEAKNEIAEAEKKVAEAKKEVAEAKKEVAEAEKKVAEAKKEVAEAMNAYTDFRGDDKKTREMLESQHNIALSQHNIALLYQKSVVEQHNIALEQLQGAISHVNALQSQLDRSAALTGHSTAEAIAEQKKAIEWEVIVGQQKDIEWDRAQDSVVRGWRREDGTTTAPKLFLRQHLLEKKKEVDKFMKNGKKKRLYVSGPPGSGKTSFFLLYATQWAVKEDQRALVVQFRERSACEIFVIDRTKVQRVLMLLTQANLLGVLKEVLEQETDFNVFVCDGVRQKLERSSDIIATLNVTMKKGIHVTSHQFNIKGGDGTTMTDEYLSMDSWNESEYLKALHCPDFKTKNEWLELLQLDDERSSEADCTQAVPANDSGSDVERGEVEDAESGEGSEGADNEDKNLEVLLERKFYYAGGSARFMFEYPISPLIDGVLSPLLERMTPDLWKEFATLRIQSKSEITINSLLQQFGREVLPVSKYILFKAYAHCSSKLVKSLNATAENAENPALQGWAFELDQIDVIQRAMTAGMPAVSSKSGDAVFPLCETKVTFDGDKIKGDITGTRFLIECVKWNQGCFDIALYHDGQLVTVQFTVSETHSLKLHFVRLLKENLEKAGKIVTEKLHHIAVVKDQDKAGRFDFAAAEGCGYDGADLLFTVSTWASSNLWLETPSVPRADGTPLEWKMGRHLRDIAVRSERRSARSKRKARDLK